MAKYIVIKELHAATEVSKNFYIFDFLFVLVYVVFSLMFMKPVVSELQIPYFIFNVGIAVKLISRTRTNPGKHYYQAIFLWYKKDSASYSSIINRGKNKLKEAMKRGLETQKENKY